MTLSADDRLAIQDLYGRYNHAIDFGDAEGWANTFTADGTFESGRGSFSGADALAEFARGYAAQMKGRHWTNNLVVDADGDGARGKCYLILYRLGGEGGPSVLTTGVYHDELVRDGSTWRFKSRKVVADA
jgi:3-phenylpropionate/cinnamic acid dioxygenase small subunit